MENRLKKQHIVSQLARREYSPNHRKTNLQILRTVVCGDSYEFRKVWEKTSKSPIFCENDKIFMDNYRTAFDGYGIHSSAPCQRFSVPKEKRPFQICDCLLSYSPCTQFQASLPTGRPGLKLYALTKWSLVVMDHKSGDIILQAYLQLPSSLNLKDISWVDPEESFVVWTTHHQPPSSNNDRGAGRAHGASPNVIKTLALFHIQPLRFVCMLEITRQVFGKDAMDASLSEGLLIIMHRNNYVRFYDFNSLLQKHQIVPQLVEDSAHLGINMKITELPCCLFETRSKRCDVKIGANPYHYIVSSYHKQDHLSVCKLETGVVVQNGILDSILGCGQMEELERAMFHADNSNRLIYICQDEVRMLRINQLPDCSSISTDFTINLLEPSHSSPVPKPPEVTLSGRIVKRRFSQEEILKEDLVIEEVNYEDELDVLVVCSFTGEESFCVNPRVNITLGLYHNTNGHLLKNIELERPNRLFNELKTTLDRDTFVQVTKHHDNRFMVQVYRLFEKCAPQDCNQAVGHCQDTTNSETPQTGVQRSRRQRR